MSASPIKMLARSRIDSPDFALYREVTRERNLYHLFTDSDHYQSEDWKWLLQFMPNVTEESL